MNISDTTGHRMTVQVPTVYNVGDPILLLLLLLLMIIVIVIVCRVMNCTHLLLCRVLNSTLAVSRERLLVQCCSVVRVTYRKNWSRLKGENDRQRFSDFDVILLFLPSRLNSWRLVFTLPYFRADWMLITVASGVARRWHRNVVLDSYGHWLRVCASQYGRLPTLATAGLLVPSDVVLETKVVVSRRLEDKQ